MAIFSLRDFVPHLKIVIAMVMKNGMHCQIMLVLSGYPIYLKSDMI